MNKDILIVLIITVVMAVGVYFFVTYSGIEAPTSKSMEDGCIEDCSLAGGEFVRQNWGYFSEDQCICKIDSEVKNIW